MSTVDFPDGTRVWARGLHDPTPQPPPELGLYLDSAWNPTWPATVLDWPDREAPADSYAAASAIRSAFAAAKAGRRVEVGCAAGVGRTGTVLACMAVLAGVPSGESIRWVRASYKPTAIETDAQLRWVRWFAARISLDLFVSCLCLIYHEARNVRHLIKEGCREAGPYKYVVSLPNPRHDAWADKALQETRSRASRSGSAAAAALVFAKRFRLTLDELVDLYEDRCWRNSARGGNRWSAITRSVIELRDSLDQDDAKLTAHLLKCIPGMCHNTGCVGEKLDELDAALEQSVGRVE